MLRVIPGVIEDTLCCAKERVHVIIFFRLDRLMKLVQYSLLTNR